MRDAERAAGVLVDRLAQMERLRTQVAWLEARPQLGRDTYARGAPESVTTTRTLTANIFELFQGFLSPSSVRQGGGLRVWRSDYLGGPDARLILSPFRLERQRA